MKKYHKTLIVSLIKDDIINSCLIDRLNKAGLDAGDYYLDLGNTIFTLLGFRDDMKSEAVYQKYLKMIKQVTPSEIKENRQKLDKFADEIYKFLKSKRG